MKRLNDIFLNIADRVSYGMGTPANIIVWIGLVICWIGAFALHIFDENTTILPSWFTSNAFNFPLNTVTTLAELYIGFLVAAAANRNERRSKEMISQMEQTLKHVENINKRQSHILKVIQSTQAEILEDEKEILVK